MTEQLDKQFILYETVKMIDDQTLFLLSDDTSLRHYLNHSKKKTFLVEMVENDLTFIVVAYFL